jgi:hypothetical protein
VNFAFNEEQEELRKTVRQFLEAKSPEAAVREQMDTEAGYDAAVWQQMGEQLGLQGLVIPEEFGGSGYGYIELVVILEEMGRALLCAPFFSSVVLAANTLIHSGDDAAKADLPPGHRLGRDHRHPGLHRGERPLGRGGHHRHGHRRRRRLEAQRHQDVRARRPHRLAAASSPPAPRPA